MTPSPISSATSRNVTGTSISDGMLNEDLEFTPQAEIRQLKRVIAEKDKAIKAFKEYDVKRSEEYNRMVENYNMMQEQFDQFCEDIRDFEEIDNRTANDFIRLFHRYYNKMRSQDMLNNILNDLKSKLNSLDKTVGKLKGEISTLDKAADKMKDEVGKYKEFIDKRQSEWKK